LKTLATLRVISPPKNSHSHGQDQKGSALLCKRLNFPLNFVTAPLVADLFLLAILAITGKEVHDGIIGANLIAPYDIMLFFLSLAYIAISVDASGLIRWLAFKVLQWGGDVGSRLFFYLYAFFFGLAAFVGNDPVILSGTAFLAYMTRVSANIKLPTAWIYTQFAVANIASAILVSSNPTNLVLAGAFNIKFIHYTANMIVPVVVTAIVLFPFLLFIIFQDRSLVPYGKIEIRQLSQESKEKKPINPNLPHVKESEEGDGKSSEETRKIRLLEEIMNPFLDKGGAAFGALLMAATLITLLAVNASTPSNSKAVPVFYITLPAAVIMFFWDLAFGWIYRKETRKISRMAQQKSEEARAAGEARLAAEEGRTQQFALAVIVPDNDPGPSTGPNHPSQSHALKPDQFQDSPPSSSAVSAVDGKQEAVGNLRETLPEKTKAAAPPAQQRTTLESLAKDGYTWCQETFPTSTAVMTHLPYALVPFAFSMFVLVQALVTKGWVPVFAYGWDHWVTKTGTIGAIGGMGFLSVILCNVSFFSVQSKENSIAANITKYSLQAQTSEPLSSSPALSRRGNKSTMITTFPSPTAPCGVQFTPWRSESITVLSVSLSVPR
jgi:Na+/H+ antiporter NhaD/arsenite permease-like protein